MQRHRLDLVSAFFGIVFTGLGLALIWGPRTLRLRGMGVLVPLLAVAFGVILLATTRRGEPRGHSDPAAATPEDLPGRLPGDGSQGSDRLPS